MINTALALFVVAALFGLYMASRIFRNTLPPVAAVVGHGLFAATGLLILLYVAFSGPAPMIVIVAAVLLVIAALGGFVMVSYQLRKVVPPKALVIVHAGAAVVGVVALLANAVGMA